MCVGNAHSGSGNGLEEREKEIIEDVLADMGLEAEVEYGENEIEEAANESAGVGVYAGEEEDDGEEREEEAEEEEEEDEGEEEEVEGEEEEEE